MWMLFARVPPDDAPYWRGRRWWAALDALVWPAGWVAAVTNAPFATGLAGALVVALAVLVGVWRFERAVRRNHRYRFTTWRWGRVPGMLLLLSWALKLVLAA